MVVPAVNAGELHKETMKDWDEYISAENASIAERLRPDHCFLWLDSHPQQMREVRQGGIVMAPMTEPSPKRVASGLIHHWIGAVFIPNARMEDVFTVIRDYDHYKDFYPSAVLASKSIRQEAAEDEFFVLLVSKALVAKTALYSRDQATFYQLDDHRWYSISYATQTQEIENYGEPAQHTLPPDRGHGYIWRLFGTNRYEERDGGVYLEVEAIVLSRDIPFAVRWLVDPIVRQLSKDSMATSLRRTEQAVGSATASWHAPTQYSVQPR